MGLGVASEAGTRASQKNPRETKVSVMLKAESYITYLACYRQVDA